MMFQCYCFPGLENGSIVLHLQRAKKHLQKMENRESAEHDGKSEAAGASLPSFPGSPAHLISLFHSLRALSFHLFPFSCPKEASTEERGGNSLIVLLASDG